jgi:hypothetical protein
MFPPWEELKGLLLRMDKKLPAFSPNKLKLRPMLLPKL